MKPLDWYFNDNYSVDHVGGRVMLIDSDNPDPPSLQLGKLGYSNAPPDSGWLLTADDCLLKQGVPPLPPAAYAVHLGERIFIYPAGYAAVVKLNGDFSLFYVG